MSLHYYESSLRKTKKFTLLSEHKNIRMFNFNPGSIMKQLFFSRRDFKFPEILEVRLNQDIYKRVCLLWNFMTTPRNNTSSSAPKTKQPV